MVPAAVAVLALIAGCGGGSKSSSSTPTSPTDATTTAATNPTISPSERPACAVLFARLQRVSVALQSSAELIAHSVNRRQLSKRIGIEEVQLQRSAQLMTGGPIPASLQATDRELVEALRGFGRAFARARAPAQRGDFRAATDAMTDAPDIQRILATSKTIENACR
jgi:hypothetical protein